MAEAKSKHAKRPRRLRLVVLASACLTLFPFAGAEGAADKAELVTPADPTTISSTGSSDSSAPVISGDGRFVVFLSSAQNLTTNASSGMVNVFLRDRQLGTTTLASVSTNGTAANGPCSSPGISSNGQFVVFQSRASNLVPGVTNGGDNVFVRDLIAEQTILASANTSSVGGNYSSLNPQMTPDGRFVVFESLADDLIANDTNKLSDIFVRDLASNNTVLASINSTGNGTGSGYSINASITPDGRFVVFESTARSLVTNDLNNTSDIFLRDVPTGTTTLISVNTADNAAGSSQRAVISDDGRYVAFESAANNLVAGDTDALNDIFLRDLQSGTTTLISPLADFNASTNAPSRPVVSRDGRFGAFQTGVPAFSSSFAISTTSHIYVWDAQAGTNILVSVSLDGMGGGRGVSYGPVISADNRYITFLSNATNLAANATNGQFQVYQRDLAGGVTALVSTSRDGTGNNLDCSSAVASDNGRIIAFDSVDGHLAPDDLNDAYDVFLRNLASESTELISRAVTNLQSATPRGLSKMVPGCVSGDGRYVVFTTLADRLTTSDTNRACDVLVRDLWNGTNALVSVNTNGTSGNGSSHNAVISADGRFVAFLSAATDLAPNVTNIMSNVYVCDVQTGATTLASFNANGAAGAGSAANPSISSDGRFIAYESSATGIASAADSNFRSDVFVFDRLEGTNILVSAIRGFNQTGNSASSNPLISPDGKWVVFESRAGNLTTNGLGPSITRIYLRDLATRETFLVSPLTQDAWLGSRFQISGDSETLAYSVNTNIYTYDVAARTSTRISEDGVGPALGGTGRFVVFEKPVRNGFSFTNSNIVAFDTVLGSEILVSVNPAGGGGNTRSRSPRISATGRFVVFTSRASDLVANDTTGGGDIFIRDMILGQTLLVSLDLKGTIGGNLISANPIMSPDGRTIVFESFASGLVTNDFNQTKDIFVVRLGLGDSDQDGMDDDWEVTYFNNLSRDGIGDFDQDGATDVSEFRAGTNPTNDASILRALSVASLSAGTSAVIWSAVPGRSYQIQFKNNLADTAWTNLPGTVIATDTTASKLDDTAGSAYRFYRVMLLVP